MIYYLHWIFDESFVLDFRFVNALKKLLGRVDAFQQRHPPVAIAYAVIKKYGQDSASNWALLIAYYGFASLFPLLLVGITVTGIIFHNDPSLRDRITNTVFAQIPVIGAQLRTKAGIHAITSNSVISFIVGILGLIWGSQGVASTAQQAMATVWNVPMTERPGFIPRTLRNLGLLGVLAGNVLVTSALATFTSSVSGHDVLRALLILATVAVNLGLYVVGFRILTPKKVSTHELLLGALVAGVAWSVLQEAGGYLVGHELVHASATYGVFGLVIGLITWFGLASTVTLYCAELNVTVVRRLWPRALVNPPLTEADKKALESLALSQRYRPEQRISVSFEEKSTENPG